MRVFAVALLTGFLSIAVARAEPGPVSACRDPAAALGVSRIVEIDASGGPIYGSMTKRTKETSFLEPMEVVLTFDDGPVPRVTTPILDTLDAFCTKATFFSVGEMALAYPHTLREVAARGHTIGTHTWTHPLNLRSLSLDKAKDQIERGFAAVALAAEQPIAPFFRFPGLSDSDEMLAYLQTRGIATFTVDIVSNDSFIGSAEHIAERTLKQIEAEKGGIVLFHDIKPATARALPKILAELKARGYRIVHLVPKAPVTPLAGYDEELKVILAKATPPGPGADAAPAASASTGPLKSLTGEDLVVTRLAPSAIERLAPAAAMAGTEQKSEAEEPVRKRRHGAAHHRSRHPRQAADLD